MVRAALTLAALALAAPATAGAADPRAFTTPSKNISCTTFGTQLRCDMARLGNERAQKPASCEFDYGSSFGVSRTGGKGRILCVSDAIGHDHKVLRYGTTWKRNSFTCRIRQSGLRCTNRRNHGFELRLGRQRLF